MFSCSAFSRRFAADVVGVKDCEDEVRFLKRFSRWPRSVLLGSGARASASNPESARGTTPGEAAGDGRFVERFSSSKSSEKVEVDRLSPTTLALLSRVVRLEFLCAARNGYAISSLTGAAISSGTSSKITPGELGTCKASKSGLSAFSKCFAHSFVR
jgi:hypothetical protein